METDNILIAKFMGEKLPYINNQGRFEYMVEGAGLISSTNAKDLYRFLRYNYNTDWNRLMQVVEKIECCDFIFSIHHEVANIFNGECNELTYNETTQARTKIEAVYNACVEFIKWYNENKSHL